MSPEPRKWQSMYRQDMKNETRGKIKRWGVRKEETTVRSETNCTDTF